MASLVDDLKTQVSENALGILYANPELRNPILKYVMKEYRPEIILGVSIVGAILIVDIVQWYMLAKRKSS